MKQKIVFVGVLNMYTGYGQHSCKIISGLDKSGYDVYVRPLEIQQNINDQKLKIPVEIARHFVHREQQEPWELLLCPPKHQPTHGKKTLFFTMWESTRLSPNQRALLNKAEAVIVPCRWNAQCFPQSGVSRPIRVVPLGIDIEQFKYQPAAKSNNFVFGCAGRIAHGDKRKGLKEVIEAFKAAFPESKDVRLSVKGFQDCAIDQGEDPRIELVQKYLEPEEYVGWLASINCFVSAARSEGWGWHQQEAMACGRPLIACQYGGLAEFFNASGGIVIPHEEVPAEEVWRGLGFWARPNFDYLVEAMRWAYRNPTKIAAMGHCASQMARRFSNQRANDELIVVMKEFGVVE